MNYTEKYLKDYQTPAFLIQQTRLNFDLEDEHTLVTACLKFKRTQSEQDKLQLDGDELELVSVKYNGKSLDSTEYQCTENLLEILKVEDEFELEIVTKIYPDKNLSLSGLYRSNKTFCTQCEAEGFRRITYYLDRPDNLSEFTTRIEAAKQGHPVLLSNGNLIKQEDLGERHAATWHDPFLKPSYLFALVAGDLGCYEDQFTTCNGKQVALKIYVEHGNEPRCEHAMNALKKAMRWDEEVYGREYDLDIFMIVAVSDFNMGAMENKGLNIFNDKYILVDPKSATDADYQAVESVVAHEYFHNWTGNRVTCRDWFQLSLKEGLTVFRDQEFSRDMNSRVVNRIEDVARLKQFQFKEDSGPNAHPVQPDSYLEINNFYTATIYEKGAELIRMLHTMVSADGFRKGTDLYFQRHDGQAVTIEDFAAAIADANQIDLSQFFLWYKQAGTPELHVRSDYDENNQTLYVHFSQKIPDTPGQTNKKPMIIPIKYGVVHKDASEKDDNLFLLKEQSATLALSNVTSEAALSLLRDFSAPVNLYYERDLSDWLTLLAYDRDGVSQYEAGQYIYRQLIQRSYHGDLNWQSQWTDAFNAMLAEPMADQALLAKLLTVPSVSELMQHYQPIQVTEIVQARESFLKQFVQAIEQKLLGFIEAFPLEQQVCLQQQAIAKRSLRNTALLLLASQGHQTIKPLLKTMLAESVMMTDQITALKALLWYYPEERAQASSDFYQQWQDDHLVLDKWFSVQAMIPDENHIDAMKQLAAHEKFSLKNPNRMRALVSAFIHFNPRAFHEPQGRAYDFLAETIKTIDKMNPQVASRLAGAFERWHLFAEPQQSLQKKSIDSILSMQDLSKDTYEILSKAIA